MNNSPNDRPSVLVAAAIIEDGDEILMTQRMPRAGHLASVWEFPGGKVEAGEDPADTVVRECLEECNANVEVIDIFDVTYFAYPQKDVVLLFYRCRFLGKRSDIQHLHVADHRWCKPSDIRALGLPPADLKVLAKIEKTAS